MNAVKLWICLGCAVFLGMAPIFLFAALNAPEIQQITIHIYRPDLPQCSDGIDNDGDGKIDYPEDPGCQADDDDDETDPFVPGGAAIPRVTQVVFRGIAYPDSPVTLLKDGQIAAVAASDPAANFEITVSGLAGGNYIFGLYAEDEAGRRSSLFNIPLNVHPNAITAVGNIFLSPTVAADKIEVKKGENIAIFGRSAPNADVVIYIKRGNKEFSATAYSRSEGFYLYRFNTALLDFGDWEVKTRAVLRAVLTSDASRSLYFKVSKETVPAVTPTPIVPPLCVFRGDINCDGRVNLVDLSILIYWFERPNPPSRVDLNGDGVVNLTDLSIAVYDWTG